MKNMKRNFHDEFIKLISQLDEENLFAIYLLLMGYMQGLENSKK